MPKKRLIITGPAGGGTGKTTSTAIVASLAALSGLTCLLVDADVTTRGLLGWLGDERVARLPADALEAGGFTASLLERAADADLVIVDAGAAAMYVPPVGPTIADCVQRFTEKGWRVTLLLSATAAKAGLRRDLERAVASFGEIADIFGAFTMTAPRSRFEALEECLKGCPTLEVPALMPPLLSEMIAHGFLPSDYVTHPPMGRKLASGLLAARLLDLARQPAMRSLFDTSLAVARLELEAERAPRRAYAIPRSIADRMLDLDCAELLALDELRGCVTAGDAATLGAARAYVRAFAARAAGLRS